jgi:hypothetical protein
MVVLPCIGNRRRSLKLLLSAGALMLAAGCADLDQSLPSDQEDRSADTQECADWFTRLDQAIDRAGVRDGEAYRIPGFPYLRVNRYLASFRQQAQKDAIAFAAWEKRLRDLDARTRNYELKNLPQPLLASLGANSRSEAAARTDRCAASMAALNATTASRRLILAERARVPDDYADWKRSAGLYPAVSLAKGSCPVPAAGPWCDGAAHCLCRGECEDRLSRYSSI